MAGKPELLILTSSFPRGPDDETCGYVKEHARGLSTRFAVTVLAPGDREGESWRPPEFELIRGASPLPRGLDPFQASADLNQSISGSPARKLLLQVSLAFFFLTAIWRARRASAIVSHWLVPCGLIGALIARLFGKPHIVIEHSGALHLLRRMRGGRFLARFIVRKACRVVVVSKDLRSKMLELCPEAAGKINVIRMGVEATPLNRVGPAALANGFDRTVLFVGRLTEIKGVDVLIRAASQVESLRLVIAGDGPERSRLERLAQELSVRTVFTGRVNALLRQDLFERCSAVVIPSREMPDGRTEGTPVVCMEAMASGCVVIASASGGLAEIVQDGHNGLLFEPENHEELALKLRSVLSSRDLCDRLATHALATAGAFDWRLTTLRFEKIIEAALGRDESIHRNHRIDIRSNFG